MAEIPQKPGLLRVQLQPAVAMAKAAGRDDLAALAPNAATATTEFFLTDDNVNIRPPFLFGNNFTDQPIIGDWDGRPLP